MECFYRSINAGMPEEQRSPDAKVIEEHKRLKDLERAAFYQKKELYLRQQFYFIYETATDDELIAYAKFSHSKSGKWLTKCYQTAILTGMKNCTEKIVKDIMEYTDK